MYYYVSPNLFYICAKEFFSVIVEPPPVFGFTTRPDTKWTGLSTLKFWIKIAQGLYLTKVKLC